MNPSGTEVKIRVNTTKEIDKLEHSSDTKAPKGSKEQESDWSRAAGKALEGEIEPAALKVPEKKIVLGALLGEEYAKVEHNLSSSEILEMYDGTNLKEILAHSHDYMSDEMIEGLYLALLKEKSKSEENLAPAQKEKVLDFFDEVFINLIKANAKKELTLKEKYKMATSSGTSDIVKVALADNEETLKTIANQILSGNLRINDENFIAMTEKGEGQVSKAKKESIESLSKELESELTEKHYQTLVEKTPGLLKKEKELAELKNGKKHLDQELMTAHVARSIISGGEMIPEEAWFGREYEKLRLESEIGNLRTELKDDAKIKAKMEIIRYEIDQIIFSDILDEKTEFLLEEKIVQYDKLTESLSQKEKHFTMKSFEKELNENELKTIEGTVRAIITNKIDERIRRKMSESEEEALENDFFEKSVHFERLVYEVSEIEELRKELAVIGDSPGSDSAVQQALEKDLRDLVYMLNGLSEQVFDEYAKMRCTHKKDMVKKSYQDNDEDSQIAVQKLNSLNYVSPKIETHIHSPRREALEVIATDRMELDEARQEYLYVETHHHQIQDLVRTEKALVANLESGFFGSENMS